MERILCAAIWYNDGKMHKHQPKNIETGYVMCGRRHHNIINLHYEFTGKESSGTIQGFITSEDRFVNRSEAYRIATISSQVKGMASNQILYSEDLY